MPTPGSLALPTEIAGQLRGATLSEVTIGLSGSDVYHVHAEGQLARYLKVAEGAARDELLDEHERLEWLHGRLGGPVVRGFGSETGRAYLLLSEVPGLRACDARVAADMPALVRLLARGLRQIHGLDVAGCPFNMRLDRRIAEAERRLRAGLVRADDFDDRRRGIPPGELFEHLLRERPAAEDLVFTHGDYCLPNVLIDAEQRRISGFIDWSRAGIADRYQDLALAARSLVYNFGPGWEPLLWEAYGLDQPDAAKVAYYQLLDEFF